MRALRLKESCTLYSSVTRDRYGDIKLNGGTPVSCLYRNIQQLTRGVNFREEIQIIGMFWVDPAANVAEGDVIGYNGQLFRIENLVTAKTLLTENIIHFYKCAVSLYRAIS